MSASDNRTWTGRLPVASDETRPFWDACNEHIFLLQRCRSCGKTQYQYRGLCCHCWSSEIEDLPATGEGTVWTYSVVHRSATSGIGLEAPYVVVLVELNEGPRVFGNLIDCDPETVEIGMPVSITFAAAPGGQHIPLFQPRA